MIGNFAKGKTAVFIDAANVFYAERTLGWRLDFEKLASYLKKETKLVEFRYYTGVVNTSEGQRSFLAKMRSFGYTVTAKDVKFIRSRDGSHVAKGSLDVELALDAYIARGRYDTLVLFSGDSDFAYLLQLLRKEGKRIIVVSTRGHVSRELIVLAKYLDLPKLRNLIGRAQKIKEPDEPAPEVR